MSFTIETPIHNTLNLEIINVLKLKCKKEYVTKEFLYAIEDVPDWENISKRKLSDDFIRMFSHKLCWMYLCRHQKLSEKILNEFHNKLQWNMICYYQELSEEFMTLHSNKMDWQHVKNRQKFSEEFKKKFIPT